MREVNITIALNPKKSILLFKILEQIGNTETPAIQSAAKT